MPYLVAFATGMLLAGTYMLCRRIYVWDAALLVGLSLGLFALLLRRRRGGHDLVLHGRMLLPRRPAGWTRVGAGVLSASVALIARSRSPDAGFASLLVVWAVAVASFLATLVVQLLVARPRRRRDHRREAAAVGVLLVLAALTRGIALGQIPANLGGDEGTQLADGIALVAAPMGNPFATGWYSVPTMSFAAYGLAMRLFGATIGGGRALSAIMGTMTVVTTYLLGRTLSGPRVGWLSAALVGFSAYHIHFSRLASNQIADPLIGTLTLWLLWQGLRSSGARNGGSTAAGADGVEGGVGALPTASSLWLGLAGIVAGAGWYAYFGARWVTFLVALVVGWRSLVAPEFLRRHWRGLLLFVCGWLVVASPLLGWYIAHPSPLTERYQAVSIFASGWLAREMVITGKSAFALMLQQLWRSAAAFHYTHDPTFWYFPQRPLLDFITGGLMLVGVVDSLARLRWPSRSMVLLWFGSTLVMAWVLTENPPSSQRGLLMVPAAAILAGWGGDLIARRILEPLLAFRWWAGALAIVVALVNGLFYFGEYTPRRIYGNPTAEIATAFARYVQANPEPVCPSATASPADCQGAVYFLGPPRLEWGFGTLRFMLRDVPGQNVAEGDVPWSVDHPARFAFVPERVSQLATVQELYPGGRVRELLSPDDRLLMVIYDWPGPGA